MLQNSALASCSEEGAPKARTARANNDFREVLKIFRSYLHRSVVMV